MAQYCKILAIKPRYECIVSNWKTGKETMSKKRNNRVGRCIPGPYLLLQKYGRSSRVHCKHFSWTPSPTSVRKCRMALYSISIEIECHCSRESWCHRVYESVSVKSITIPIPIDRYHWITWNWQSFSTNIFCTKFKLRGFWVTRSRLWCPFFPIMSGFRRII